jgi:GH15 family glucan-1,4-alpha-glucosidase
MVSTKYPEIADHGLIGDFQTAALVARDGTVDWFCAPRFDSPSIFAALLDADRGGRCRIAPVGTTYETRQIYLPDTANLVTRFMTPDGVGEVIDFMPLIQGNTPTARHRIARLIRVVRGQLRFLLECEPRFDYARQDHDLQQLGDSEAVFRSRGQQLALACDFPLISAGNDVRGEKTLRAGQSAFVILDSAPSQELHRPGVGEVEQWLKECTNFWQSWVKRSTYHGRWREMVTRSAITLKLMTYAPTGGLVAAPTMGLPEQIGGMRNWDYRFTWIRDASLSVEALLNIGFVDEAAAFMIWLYRRLSEESDGPSGPLKIMYRIDGSADLREESLPHLEGYRGSRPVRIGNGAGDQLQLDIYGEMVDALYIAQRKGLKAGYEGWRALLRVYDWLIEHWDQPEEGIWETRGGRQPFVYGRLMSWVALDRAIRMANEDGKPADVNRLARARDAIYQQINDKGWNPRVRAYSQSYGSDVLDASILHMPRVNFVVPSDARWIETLRATRRELVSDSLVYRYNPSASPDGLAGSEGTFSLCTFWFVDALARSGYIEEARLTFEKMLTYANHLGLFAEEIGLTGEQLGNFPQAFTHLALINAAITLNESLDRDTGIAEIVARIEDQLGVPRAKLAPVA